MAELRPIHRDAIPRALEKAERYRLLNEPFEAESICRDVLAIDPDNQEALVCLILAQTDRFSTKHVRVEQVRELLQRLRSDFDRAYYGGVIEERWAKTMVNSGYPLGSVQSFLRTAMGLYEKAEKLAPAGNDDAILRWNACVRILERNRFEQGDLVQAQLHESFDDDVPLR